MVLSECSYDHSVAVSARGTVQLFLGILCLSVQCEMRKYDGGVPKSLSVTAYNKKITIHIACIIFPLSEKITIYVYLSALQQSLCGANSTNLKYFIIILFFMYGSLHTVDYQDYE